MKLGNEYYQLVKMYRRDLHQIPEIGFDLNETSAYLKQELSAIGYQYEEVARTGIIAIKEGMEPGAIAFRADMDGLMIEEKTNHDFQSLHQGMMHACGHDGHMAILLGFAKYLTTIPKPKKTIILLFQPAEESPGGAKVIIESGLFERYPIEAIFAVHLDPSIEEHQIGLISGAMMAQSGELDVIIKGRSAHGGKPHLGSDAIIAGSQLINGYQTIISRNLDPLKPGVITIGMITGGDARNIIASQVMISGTIRAFDSNQYQMIKTRIQKINDALSIMNDVEIDTDIRDLYPPVINDDYLYQKVKKCLAKDEYQEINPSMLAEDFSYYQQKTPGLLMMLGVRNEKSGYINPLHSCYFNFDEIVLVSGIELYIHICQEFNII